nr:hypothetical protein [Bradyrhizobium sp. WSM3983]
MAFSKNPLLPTQRDPSGTIDRANIPICCIADLINDIVGDADVICLAEIVLQRLQTPDKRSNSVLSKQASQKFDDVVQMLQRDTQPVPLRCRKLFEPLATLASLAVLTIDQVGGNIDDRR